MPCMSFSRGHLTALLALVLLASIPAAAQARNFKVDGRVTGPPLAKGGAVTVPLQLTKRTGRALKLGTRKVRVRFRRARLPLSGAAGRSRRLAPRALRNGDRLKGVTSLSRKSRLRLRYRARPTLKLKRPRVIRGARRRRAAPWAPAPSAAPARTPEQIVADIGARATALSGRIGRLSSLTQQVARLQTLRLPVGLAGVTVAFESLTTALENRASTDPAFGPLLTEVEALAPGAEWLGTAMGAVDTSLRTSHVLIVIGDAVETLAVDSVVLATHIELLKQIPGVVAQLVAIEAALGRIDGRLATVDAASGSLGSRTRELNDGMASLTDAANALATSAQAGAEPASLSAGVDALATDVAGLDSGFAALQTSLDGVGPELDALQADAATLEAMVEALEALGMGGG
jgi:outer membrane murein-binding lipoprotein Lpp